MGAGSITFVLVGAVATLVAVAALVMMIKKPDRGRVREHVGSWQFQDPEKRSGK